MFSKGWVHQCPPRLDDWLV